VSYLDHAINAKRFQLKASTVYTKREKVRVVAFRVSDLFRVIT